MTTLPPDLHPEHLLFAYSQGFFPMPDQDQAERILWYAPDPRAIMPLEGFHVSRSLRRSLRKVGFTWTLNRDFKEVMLGCANRDDTWINEYFLWAYHQLHQLGFAHSLEVWLEGKLVGGVYGVSLGGAFFAESKFHRVSDASKVALYHLVEHLKARGFSLLEIQFMTDHLESLGAINVHSEDYQQRLALALAQPVSFV